MNTEHAAVQKPRFIRKTEVCHRTGFGNSVLYKMIQERKFPAPIHPHGTRSAFWEEAAVDRWLSDRLAEAGQQVAA
ncbi:MAG TPA: hypothetical protein DEQ20_00605 [Desulfobulbaceae bacterium]|nr:MAG: hypothetical protein A2520_00080 [Deltaproteobacteria bacterium RIFOXYD12_FULL_53_23]HCC53419.1 hypothetical protein [Desulfobulbaceae bacterium]